MHAWHRNVERRDDYCGEHGLNVQTFNFWVGRLRDELRPGSNGPARTSNKATAETSAAATFIPVEIAADDETPSTSDEPATAPIEVDVHIVLIAEPVDFRKGPDSLARLVEQHLQAHPFGGDLFVFRAKRPERTPFSIQFVSLSGHLSLAPTLRAAATERGSEPARG